MKIRIITGVVATVLTLTLFSLTAQGRIGLLSIPIALLSAIAAYEVMRVSKCKNKLLTACSMIFAAAVPLYVDFDLQKYIPVPTSVIIIIYVIVMLIIMLKYYDITKFENVAMALFASIAVPGALSTILKVMDFNIEYPQYFQRSHCVLFILCAMYCAWMSDTWAYFFGRKFGKHKLAPKISPKKSVEGAIAGVFGTTLFCVGTYLVCDHFCFTRLHTVNVWMILFGAIFLAILGMCGDLAASVIKRNYGEKDFGSIFPGHGGVLDRIDSFLFTMPATYAIIKIAMAFVEK